MRLKIKFSNQKSLDLKSKTKKLNLYLIFNYYKGGCMAIPKKTIGKGGSSRGGSGSCGGTPKRDGSGGGVGNKGTKNQPPKK